MGVFGPTRSGLPAAGAYTFTLLPAGDVACPAGMNTQIATTPLPAIQDIQKYIFVVITNCEIAIGAVAPTTCSFTFGLTMADTTVFSDTHAVTPAVLVPNATLAIPMVMGLTNFRNDNLNPQQTGTLTMTVSPVGQAVTIKRSAGMTGYQSLGLILPKPS
jgi:hypothetical protein